MKALMLKMIFLLYVGSNIVAFINGIIVTRECGLFNNLKCISENGKQQVIENSRWVYLFPGYNAGVNFGIFMNQGSHD